MELKCNCGKTYKTERGYSNHIKSCKYKDMDLEKIYKLGELINECNAFLFQIGYSKINKYKREHNCTKEEAKKILLKENIYKYRKALWDILEAWKEELLPSEYREFTKWVFKTYKGITLISLKNVLSNNKILYRFNIENTQNMIKKRIEMSLLYIHTKKVFDNDFDFIDSIMSGNISLYYVLFNDWLATNWFSNLDSDIQKEMFSQIELASKIIIERISHKEFDELQALANSATPKILEFD